MRIIDENAEKSGERTHPTTQLPSLLAPGRSVAPDVAPAVGGAGPRTTVVAAPVLGCSPEAPSAKNGGRRAPPLRTTGGGETN